MPAGCEFTCDNEECENVNTGFVVLGPWPLGRIELVIEDTKVKENVDFRNDLVERKNEGHKHVCINFPNDADIPIDGYRIQKWCGKCKCLWNYDAMLEGEEDSMEDAVERSDIPYNCVKCEAEMKDFADILEDGIDCPSCKVALKQNRWVSKEG